MMNGEKYKTVDDLLRNNKIGGGNYGKEDGKFNERKKIFE